MLTIGETTAGEPFALPAEAVTETFAILAKRRAGKSYTAARFVEELLKAAQQVVVVDPKGDWKCSGNIRRNKIDAELPRPGCEAIPASHPA